MLRALIVKELRESVGLVALAVLASAYVLAESTGVRVLPWQAAGNDQAFPFVSGDGLILYLSLVAGGLAILLGLKQSAWELGHGTYCFLLHRPVSHRRVFGTKLAVGCALLLLVTGVLILAYAVWAAMPGHHATPFFWSMTARAWQLWFSMPVLYLGAFLSGIRPGRWFGSRLLPLAAGGLMVLWAAAAPWGWLGLVIVVMVVSTIFVTGIFHHVDTRDY